MSKPRKPAEVAEEQPQHGGSYTRQPDGSLVRDEGRDLEGQIDGDAVAETAPAAAPAIPADPASMPVNKEA